MSCPLIHGIHSMEFYQGSCRIFAKPYDASVTLVASYDTQNNGLVAWRRNPKNSAAIIVGLNMNSYPYVSSVTSNEGFQEESSKLAQYWNGTQQRLKDMMNPVSNNLCPYVKNLGKCEMDNFNADFNAEYGKEFATFDKNRLSLPEINTGGRLLYNSLMFAARTKESVIKYRKRLLQTQAQMQYTNVVIVCYAVAH